MAVGKFETDRIAANEMSFQNAVRLIFLPFHLGFVTLAHSARAISAQTCDRDVALMAIGPQDDDLFLVIVDFDVFRTKLKHFTAHQS